MDHNSSISMISEPVTAPSAPEDGDIDYNSPQNRYRNESVTELPALQENGERATERTEIPSPRPPKSGAEGGAAAHLGAFESDLSSDLYQREQSQAEQAEGDNSSSSNDKNEGKNKSQQQVAKAEGKKGKIVTRVVSGALMIALFLGLMYMGHLYICLLVAMVEILLVRTIFVFSFGFLEGTREMLEQRVFLFDLCLLCFKHARTI